MRAALLAVAVVLLLGAGGYVAYDYFSTPRSPAGGESIEIVKPAPAVRKLPKKKVTIKAPVEVYAGDSKAQLKLPDEARANPNAEVLTAAQVQPSLRPQTVTTTIDTETGQTKTYVKADPYPWLAIENRGSVGLAYGYKIDANTRESAAVGRFQLGSDALRVKALTVGVTASVDSDREAFVGVGVTWRW